MHTAKTHSSNRALKAKGACLSSIKYKPTKRILKNAIDSTKALPSKLFSIEPPPNHQESNVVSMSNNQIIVLVFIDDLFVMSAPNKAERKVLSKADQQDAKK